jgi:hypothetical protein
MKAKLDLTSLFVGSLLLMDVASAADISEPIDAANEHPGIWNETTSTCSCYPQSMRPDTRESREACALPDACYKEQTSTQQDAAALLNTLEAFVINGAGTQWYEGFIALHNVDNDTGIRFYAGGATPKHHIFNNNAAGDLLRISPIFASGGISIEQGGNVGVNTGNNAPQATLDINGIMKLKAHSAAPNFPPCGSMIAVDGLIALTSKHTLCVCSIDAGGWVEASDGSSSCTW